MTRIGKFNRLTGRATGKMVSLPSVPWPQEPEPQEDRKVSPIRGGMNTSIVDTELDDNTFIDIKNFYRQQDRLVMRKGMTRMSPARPDAVKILGLYSFLRYTTSLDYLRFTKSSVYKLAGGVFTAIAGAALGGGDYDRFSIVFIQDRIFFNNNGLDVLMEANLSANTYAAAGASARKYKYYAPFGERIIGANLVGVPNNPIEIGTCGIANFGVWDPAVDISAYRGNLIEPEASNTDEITGLVNLDNILLVLRSGSIWWGVPQPIASTPFNWQKQISGIGCNAPFSVQKVRNGVVWYDPVLSDVFLYTSEDNKAVRIGEAVRDSINAAIGDIKYVFSGYDRYRDIYELGIENPATGVTKIWQCYLKDFSWTYEEVPLVSALANTIDLVASSSIDSLGATAINSLTGTIDGLSTSKYIATAAYGLTDGERFTPTAVSGGIDAKLAGNVSYSAKIEFKKYVLPTQKQTFNKFYLEIIPRSSLTVKLYAYIDDRGTATLLKTTTVDAAEVGKNYLIKYNKALTCKSVKFYFEFSDGTCDVVSYSLRRYPAGDL